MMCEVRILSSGNFKNHNIIVSYGGQKTTREEVLKLKKKPKEVVELLAEKK